MTAFEVSFRIQRKASFDNGELVTAACDALFRAVTGLQDTETLEAYAMRDTFEEEVGRKLAAGSAVRISLSPLQFARFFVERRKAGGEVPRRLNWFDAVEVEG